MKQISILADLHRAFRDKYPAALLAVILLLFSSIVSAQQNDSTRYSNDNSYGKRQKRSVNDSLLVIPPYESPHTGYRSGPIYYRKSDSSIYVWTGSQKLRVGGSGSGIDTAYTVDDTTIAIESGSKIFFMILRGTPDWHQDGNAGTTPNQFIGTTDDKPVRLSTNGINRVLIDSLSGKVTFIQDTDSLFIIPGSTNLISASGGSELAITTNNSTRFKIKNNGRIGVGGIEPLELLDVAGNIQTRDGFIVYSPELSPLRGEVYHGGSYLGIRTITSDPIIIETDNTSRAEFTETGLFNVFATTNLIGGAFTPPVSDADSSNSVETTGRVKRLLAAFSGSLPQSWGLLGNAGINPSSNFIGTTDAQPVVIKTNNAERGRISSAGQLFWGPTNTSVFSSDLKVESATGSLSIMSTATASGTGGGVLSLGQYQSNPATGNRFGSIQFLSSYTSNSSVATSIDSYNSGGGDVNSNINGGYLTFSTRLTGGNPRKEQVRISNYGYLGIRSGGAVDPWFGVHARISDIGGSATNTIASTGAIDGTGSGNFFAGRYGSTIDSWVDPTGAVSLGQYGFGVGSNYVSAMTGGASAAFTGTSRPSYLSFNTTPVGSTTMSEAMRINPSGNVGIGTNNPLTKLHIVGSDDDSVVLITSTSPTFSQYPLRIRSTYSQALLSTTDDAIGNSGITFSNSSVDQNSTTVLSYFPSGKMVNMQIAPNEAGWRFSMRKNTNNYYLQIFNETGHMHVGNMGTLADDLDDENALKVHGSAWIRDTAKAIKMVQTPVLSLTPIASAPSSPSNGMSYYNSTDNKVYDRINGAWVERNTGAGSGVTAVGTINGVTKDANGAVISGTSIYMQTADATNPGLVSTGTQTFAGAKTFSAAPTFSNGFTIAATAGLVWSGRSRMSSGADGIITMQNNASNGFTGATWGPATSSHAGIFKSGTTLSVRLGDNSADAPFGASGLTLSGLAGTGTRLGTYSSTGVAGALTNGTNGQAVGMVSGALGWLDPVLLTGNQTVAGIKSFTDRMVITKGSGITPDVNNLLYLGRNEPGNFYPLFIIEDKTDNGYAQFGYWGKDKKWNVGVGNGPSNFFNVADKYYILDAISNTIRFVIDPNGRTGIGGITDPNSFLHVPAGTAAAASVTIPETSTAPSSPSAGQIWNLNGNLTFRTGSTDKVLNDFESGTYTPTFSNFSTGVSAINVPPGASIKWQRVGKTVSVWGNIGPVFSSGVAGDIRSWSMSLPPGITANFTQNQDAAGIANCGWQTSRGAIVQADATNDIIGMSVQIGTEGYSSMIGYYFTVSFQIP